MYKLCIILLSLVVLTITSKAKDLQKTSESNVSADNRKIKGISEYAKFSKLTNKCQILKNWKQQSNSVSENYIKRSIFQISTFSLQFEDKVKQKSY